MPVQSVLWLYWHMTVSCSILLGGGGEGEWLCSESVRIVFHLLHTINARQQFASCYKRKVTIIIFFFLKSVLVR